jgi:hypothetical protein
MVTNPKTENPITSPRWVVFNEDGGRGVRDWVGGDSEGIGISDWDVSVGDCEEGGDVVPVARYVDVSYTEVNAVEEGIMIGAEIEFGLVLLAEYSVVSVGVSGGDVGGSRSRRLIGESEVGVEGCREGNRRVGAEVEAMLSLGTERSSTSRVAFLTLVSRMAGPSTGREVFQVIGINLAAMGGKQKPRTV